MEKQQRLKLNRIRVEGFKSIREMDLEMRDINVLIGGNGSGKSNFLSFFRFLREMVNDEFQIYIARNGSADFFLHYGTKVTENINIFLELSADKTYRHLVTLVQIYSPKVTPMTLSIHSEKLESLLTDTLNWWQYIDSVGAGYYSGLVDKNSQSDEEKKVSNYYNNLKTYHLDDTSENAKIRKTTTIYDNVALHKDGGNLASILYKIKTYNSIYYRIIVDTIKLAAPFFGDFILEPYGDHEQYLILKWREKGSDVVFGPHQLPDGLLRFMVLTTLLLQPEKMMPKMIIIDEPELGLHPYAIELFASMVREASQHSQIIIATQSETLIDKFEAKDIIVVNRREGASEFNRLNEEELKEWLEEYSLSELWAKNVIEGRP